MPNSPDVTAFLAALPPALRPSYEELADLEPAIARLVAAAEVTDPARFVTDLAARLPTDAPPAQALAAVRAADLALAMACARGEPAALVRFEAELFEQVDIAHARFRNLSITRDEVRQAMRDRLFVGTPPRIASYQGRGDLRAWVRMTAVRYLVDLARADSARPDRLSRESGDDEKLAEAATSGDDPELAFLKDRYRAEFKISFRNALEKLEPRDRNILRHRYLDGLEVAELATIYDVHRVSMSRTLSRIRDDLLAAIRNDFLSRLGVGSSELDSVMTLIASRLEVSLSGLLRK
jgi:RNA polymerase sigma-70 factor (ECF subfamily)